MSKAMSAGASAKKTKLRPGEKVIGTAALVSRKPCRPGDKPSAKAAAKIRAMNPYMASVVSTPAGVTIKAPTDTKDGQWCCADCGEMLQNNTEAYAHRAPHRLVWWTGEQFESPV